ncbi:superoxide dismutase family protein [soil metagenome]
MSMRIPMHSRTVALSLALLAGLGGCAMYATHDSPNPRPGAQAKLYDAAGREAGFVMVTLKGDDLTGAVNVNGISPGPHAIHLHAVGKCEAPGFTTAGGHLNPDSKQHGLENPMGAHQGDLPEMIVGTDGTGHATFPARTTLETLFDADGAAFVVHAAADDNKTDPTGNSGARILCGVLERIPG